MKTKLKLVLENTLTIVENKMDTRNLISNDYISKDNIPDDITICSSAPSIQSLEDVSNTAEYEEIESEEVKSALHQACKNKDLEAASMLLGSGGFDIDYLDETKGFTALHYACINSDLAMVELLLKNGARPDCRAESTGVTPLHFSASRSKDIEIVKLLISYGANVNAMSYRSLAPLTSSDKQASPLNIACRMSGLEMIKILIDNGANVNECFIHDTMRGNILHSLCSLRTVVKKSDLVKILIKNGLDVNARIAENGFTPLHVACYSMNNSEFSELTDIRLLIENGADIDAQTPEGYTALHFCAARSHKSTELLLKEGADPHILSKKGEKALDIACISSVADLIKKSSVRNTLSDINSTEYSKEHCVS